MSGPQRFAEISQRRPPLARIRGTAGLLNRAAQAAPMALHLLSRAELVPGLPPTMVDRTAVIGARIEG